MTTYLQESKFKKNSFLCLDGPKGATHFRNAGGDIQPIVELQTTNRHPGGNPCTEKPMELPTMNFEDGKQRTESGPLDLPSVL